MPIMYKDQEDVETIAKKKTNIPTKMPNNLNYWKPPEQSYANQPFDPDAEGLMGRSNINMKYIPKIQGPVLMPGQTDINPPVSMTNPILPPRYVPPADATKTKQQQGYWQTLLGNLDRLGNGQVAPSPDGSIPYPIVLPQSDTPILDAYDPTKSANDINTEYMPGQMNTDLGKADSMSDNGLTYDPYSLINAAMLKAANDLIKGGGKQPGVPGKNKNAWNYQPPQQIGAYPLYYGGGGGYSNQLENWYNALMNWRVI